MKAMRVASTVSIALLLSCGARAENSEPFAKWLDKAAPECVPVAEFNSVAKTIRLTPEQFEFVRALYVAIPPMSKKLPPGDHAVLAVAKDQAMLALVTDDVSCARFLAPDFVVAMLMQVGAGASVKIGDPASYETYR